TPSDYPVVDIVDDGIDNGTDTPLHPDFYQSGDKNKPDRLVYNNNCTTDATADGQGGHGNLNAGIVGAYNDKTGSPFQDANGYSYGLGVSPYSRIAGTKIFRNSGSYDVSGCAGTDEGVVARSYNSGATITSDSWGADNGGAYDASSRAYDVLTRDASSATPGNQEMLHVFAAGNAGPNLGTVGSPASAKNVLTVGGTENVRDEGVADGCGVTNSNSANDVFIQGSRGPTADKRSKPDVVAPAIHVQGPASQDPTFDATGVCAMQNSNYYPPGQTFYTWSSGTSHSTPAVAGAASLIYSYYKRVMNPGHNPSPAMLKGLMVNGARYLNGNGFNDTLPSNNQGWGGANLAPLFDSSTQYCVLLDQTNLFTATGQEYSTNCTVADTNKPVRITLAYTDAPGPTTGNAYVNDLNLSVVANRQLYLGNVFNGAFSTTGGVADPRNNVESVFLPAGTSGPLLTKVTAANIAGDGVPGNASQLDQDFVLIISNAVPSNSGVVALTPGAVNFSDTPPNANNNGIIEPGETIKLNMALSNPGNLTATAISSSLQANTPGVTVLNGQSGYADIPAGATGSNQLPYTFSLASNFNCGSPISFTQFVTYSNNLVMSQTVTFPTGVANGRSLLTTYNATDIPKAIPDGNTAGVNSVMVTSTPGTVDQMRVKLNITHTWDGDLTVKLTSPSNTTITLVARRGGSGDNFTNTYLDDSATVAISSGTAPFTGTYRPEQALSAFKGQPITGNWTLNVSDAVNIDTGTLQGWSIDFFNTTYGCAPATPGPAATLQVSGYPSPVVVGTANQFTVTAKDAQGNTAVNYAGTITLSSSDPSATFSPASYTFQPSDFGVKTLTATLATAGTQSITATDNVSPGVTGSQTGIQVLNPPSVITPVGGSTPQSASTNKLFAQRLQAVVKNSDGISMTNQTVAFTAPGSGASGTFTGNNSTTITVQTNAQGIADAGQFLANGVGGDYQVTATVAGVANPAVFQLTNVPSACNAFQVSSPTDDSSGLECGTLSYALLQASGNQTITFNLPAGTNTITVTNMLPPVPQSVTIDGGSCTNGPAIIIKGSGATGSGLRLSGANTIMNLQVMGFPDQQVVTKGTGNKLGRCVVAKK
ncbi:MAG TPA: S8 family serine peptidase, partial [Chloroflexia bacterium]|nr:S8 family serine peptidase [Chloroflexia bacterium]